MNLYLSKDQADALHLTLRDVIEIEGGHVLLEPVRDRLERLVGRPVAEPIPGQLDIEEAIARAA